MTGLEHFVKVLFGVGALDDLAHGGRNLHQIDLFAPEAGIGHVAARHHNRGNVAAGSGHELPRDNGVTGGQKHHAVKHVRLHIEFHLIRHQVAGGKLNIARVFQHHAVANTGSRYLEGQTACLTDTVLYPLRNLSEMHVAWIVLIPGIHDGDVGALDLFLGIAHAVEHSVPLHACHAKFPFASFKHHTTSICS